ncbi:MAG: bifunctional oligoribonuclease/PAP phosphatase NrnA [Chthoniobacterales bacterium]
MVSFSEICKALQPAHRILVVSHHRPDGDALGSTIAAALWLKQEGHEVSAWNEDGLPSKFSYLPEANLISKPPEKPENFDAILVLDTATKNRLGSKVLTSACAPLWVTIDHHISNENFGSVNLIDPRAPATGQILAEGFLSGGIAITQAMAINLYAAISTDTGSFQYDSTSARTFEIAAALLRAGVPVGELSKAMYEHQPKRRWELLRHALQHSKFSCHDRIASFTLSRADALLLGVQPEDTEGIIDHLRSVEGVIAAAFFEELLDHRVRLSLRSKDRSFDACALCQEYGGGGHVMAAGASIQGSLADVEKRVLASLENAISTIKIYAKQHRRSSSH